MNAPVFALQADVSQDPLLRYSACKAMARGYAESKKTDKTRLTHARAYCTRVITAYWDALAQAKGSRMKVRAIPTGVTLATLPIDAQGVADDTGRLVASFPVEDAGYLIGSIYTVMLPSDLRSELGAYYTPPPLVSRLLDQAEGAGFDFGMGSAIDPACGGGAFLAPVALRMWNRARESGAADEWIFRSLVKRLRGIELDPFAAWMSRTLLEAALLPLCIAAKKRLPEEIVISGNALEPRDIGQFDLVIGNPPYGRVTLEPSMRALYARSLYGHANLYGLFTDLALRLAKRGGVISYLTPTSFLGGQYFMALRHLLTSEACPVAFDFVADRDGVFDDVLQETLLTSFKVTTESQPARVSLVVPKGLNAAKVEKIGDVSVQPDGAPWLLPRTPRDANFLAQIHQMPTRLADLGFAVSTGQLVWNRHKDQLRQVYEKGALPLVWAESITSEGFNFSAARRGHVPFIQVKKEQPHLITKAECVLVQRTTSKEQERRLLAAVLPASFLKEHGGAVIENHLNMVYPNRKAPAVSAATISVLLNSMAVDRAFRCISGSVAVSAYELNSIPLPSPEQLVELEKLIKRRASKATLESAVDRFYGVTA